MPRKPKTAGAPPPADTAVKPAPRKRKPGKNKGGRPGKPISPETRMLVKTLIGYGFSQEQVCKRVKFTLSNFQRRFAEEIATGKIEADSLVVQSLFKMATTPGPQAATAAIYWTKTRMGWKEPERRVRHAGAVGTYDLSKVSDADLSKLENILAPIADAGGDPDRDSEAEGGSGAPADGGDGGPDKGAV